jgi:hypothetical protein
MDSRLDEFKIEDNIYLSDETIAFDREFLQKYKIKRILSLLKNKIPSDKKVDHILYKQIAVEDNKAEDIITYFPECIDFISVAQTFGKKFFSRKKHSNHKYF